MNLYHTALINLIISRVKDLPAETRAMLVASAVQNLANENDDVVKTSSTIVKMPKPDDKEVT